LERSEQIRQLLAEQAGRFGPPATMLATVKSVDEASATCVLYDEETDLDYYDVRLKPVVDTPEALTIFPAVGTWCIAVRIEGSDEWMAIAFNQAVKWRLKVGQAVIEQNETGLLIQKQTDTLRQALELLVQAVQQIVVVQGRGPDQVKLTQALTKIQNILR
jgi:hypothetical protein